MSTEWFPLAPTDSATSRITLDFGLRGANRHFLELVVPGIGGVSFVRQLSWAASGLSIRDTLADQGTRSRATPLANALEALGCKAEFVHSPDDVSPRVLGRRAFRRDGDDVGSFHELCDRRHYVQNTFRGVAVRALREETGLGFARGPRFDALTLTDVGYELSSALLDDGRVGRGGGSLRRWLCAWIGGEKDQLPWGTLREVMSPETPTKRERLLVRTRLLDVTSGPAAPAAAKRKLLADLMEDDDDAPELADVSRRLRKTGQEEYAREVELAAAFGALLDGCIDVTVAGSVLLEKAGVIRLDAASLTLEGKVRAVRERAQAYLRRHEAVPAGHPDALRLARTATTESDTGLLHDIIRRESRVLEVVDGVVHKGPLFRNLANDDVDGNEHEDEGVPADDAGTDRTFRISQLHELLKDTRRRR